MNDARLRSLERAANAGDPGAAKAHRRGLCQNGDHEWQGKSWKLKCAFCGADKQELENAAYAIQCARKRTAKRAVAIALCEAGVHDWVPGDEISDECGCPSDPGIHGCHPFECSVCFKPEFDEEDE